MENQSSMWVSIFQRFWRPLGTIWGAFGEPFGVFGPPKSLIIIEQGVFLYLLIDVLEDLGSQEAILEPFGTVQAPQKSSQGPCWKDFCIQIDQKCIPLTHLGWMSETQGQTSKQPTHVEQPNP